MAGENKIILFDGICNLCNAAVQFIISRDKKRKFRFGSLQSEAGQQILRRFGLKQEDFDTIVLIEGTTYYTKSTAALKIAKELSGIWKLGYAFMVIPVPVRNLVYDLVARSRYGLFGKRKDCMVPTAELKGLFIE